MNYSYSKKSEGVATLAGPYGEMIFIKTITCGHCQRLVFVAPEGDGTNDVAMPKGSEHVLANCERRIPPAVCHICWSLVCPQCHAKGNCTPWEQQMERIEARDEFLRSAGLERSIA